MRWEDFEHAPLGDLAAARDKLAWRDALNRRAQARIDAGTHDPAGPAEYPPLTVAEHLRLLATGEAIRRKVSHPASVHNAVAAGVTWPQIAAALGIPASQARIDYLEWARGQHHLHVTGGRWGLDETAYAKAVDAAHVGDDGEPLCRRCHVETVDEPGSDRVYGVFCTTCVNRCHDALPAEHRCVVCTWPEMA